MKKQLLLLLFFPLFAAAQSVPNGNFETWSMVGMNENPDSWITDNTEVYATVTKDLDAYEGEIAMRVAAKPTGLGEYGEAYTTFDLDAIPSSLNFYAKSDINSGSAVVEITFLNQDIEILTEQWFISTSIPNYTFISIPLNQIEPSVITHARVKVSAYVPDLISGSAWISVDAMTLGAPLSVRRAAFSTFKIYPNPTSEYLTIQIAEGTLGNIKVFDAQGIMVLEKRVSDTSAEIDIRKLAPGVYTLTGDHRDVKAAKFIVKD